MWYFIVKYWDYIDKVGTLLGIFGAGLAAWGSLKLRSETNRQREKENQQISVKLRNESLNKEYIFDFELRRGDLSRAELLGLIGMLPMKEAKTRKRFEITFLSSRDFSNQLARIRELDDISEFIIPCSEEELGQFNCTLTSIT